MCGCDPKKGIVCETHRNTVRVIAREIRWVEEDGTVVHGERIRFIPMRDLKDYM